MNFVKLWNDYWEKDTPVLEEEVIDVIANISHNDGHAFQLTIDSTVYNNVEATLLAILSRPIIKMDCGTLLTHSAINRITVSIKHRTGT